MDFASLLTIGIDTSDVEVADRALLGMATAGEATEKRIRSSMHGVENSTRHAAEEIAQSSQRITRQSRQAVNNLSYQLTDIAQMTAAGQSPFMLMMQQGEQTAGALRDLGRTGGGALKGLAAAFTQVLNPVSLATYGVILFGSMAVQHFMASRKTAEEFSDVLKDVGSDIDEYLKMQSEGDSGFEKAFKSARSDLEATSQAYRDLIAIAKTEAFNGIQDLNESLAAAALNASWLKSEMADAGDLLDIETALQGHIGIWKENREVVSGFISDLATLRDASELDEQYQAALRVRDTFVGIVGTTDDMSKAQLEFYKNLSETIMRMELLGATVEGVAGAAAQQLASAYGQYYASRIAGEAILTRQQAEAAEKAKNAWSQYYSSRVSGEFILSRNIQESAEKAQSAWSQYYSSRITGESILARNIKEDAEKAQSAWSQYYSSRVAGDIILARRQAEAAEKARAAWAQYYSSRVAGERATDSLNSSQLRSIQEQNSLAERRLEILQSYNSEGEKTAQTAQLEIDLAADLLRSKLEQEIAANGVTEAEREAVDAAVELLRETLGAELALDDAAAAAARTKDALTGAALEAAILAGNLRAAVSALASVASATAGLNISAVGLEAQNRAIKEGNSLIQARAEGLKAQKRAELESAFGSGDAIIRAAAAKELEAYTEAVDRNSSAQAVNEKLVDAVNEANKKATGSSKKAKEEKKSYIDQLKDEIKRDKELIGLSEEATAEIEARHKVEDALAKDKATWGEKAKQDLVDQILLNRQLTEEAKRTSEFYKTLADGIANGDFGGILDKLGSQSRDAFSGELQKVFSGDQTFGGIFTDSFDNIGKALSGGGGALGNIGAAIGAAMPVIGGVLAAVDLVKSLVGTTTKLTNALEGTLGIEGLLRGSEYDVKRTDNLFGSKTEKNSEEIFGSWAKYIAADLDREFRSTMENAIKLVDSLGLGFDQAFTFDFDVKFDESLPHEELMERLRAELAKAEDAFYTASLEAAGLAREGETGAETLNALNLALTSANANLNALGFVLFDLSAFGAGAAREFTELFGGVDAFAQGMSSYIDAFYDNESKLEVMERRVQDMLSGLDVNNVNTAFSNRDNFRALTDWAGSNAAGDPNQAQMFASLINVAPLMDQIFELRDAIAAVGEEAEETTEEIDAFAEQRRFMMLELKRLEGDIAAVRQMELDALDPSLHSLQQLIWARQDQNEADAEAEALLGRQLNMQKEYLRVQGDLEALRDLELGSIDESLRPLQLRIWAIEDAAEADAKAAAAAADKARLEEQIADEAMNLHKQYLELMGDEAALREIALGELNESNRARQQEIWDLQDQIAAEEERAAKLDKLGREIDSLTERRLQLMGDEAALRERELSALEPAAQSLQRLVWALEDTAAAAAEAAAAENNRASERKGLMRQYNELIGDTAANRAMDLLDLDPANRDLQKTIWQLERAAADADKLAQKQAAAAQRELEIANEKEGLLRQLAEVESDLETIRRMELEALDPSNHALQELIWLRQEENEATAEAARLAQQELDERLGLEGQLLQLQGNIAELRRRELEALFPANRALQEQIWALQDAEEAQTAYNQSVADAASKMREALSVVERLINNEIASIRDAAEARINEAQSNLDAVRDAADGSRSALDTALEAIRASVDAERTLLVNSYSLAIERLDASLEAATSRVGALQAVFDMLDSALASRGPLGFAAERDQYLSAQGYVNSLGSVPNDTSRLESSLQSLSGDGSKFYSSFEDYQFDFLRTNASLRNLRSEARDSLSDAERQVRAIESLKESRTVQHELEIARLDGQLELAQAIYDEALGNTIELINIRDGIQGLRAAADEYTNLADYLNEVEESTQREIQSLREASEAQISALELQLEEAQRAVAIAEGTYQSLTSIDEAMAFLNSTIEAFYQASAKADSDFADDVTQPIIDTRDELVEFRRKSEEAEARSNETQERNISELQQLRDEIKQLLKPISWNTKVIADLQEKFDIEGIKERV